MLPVYGNYKGDLTIQRTCPYCQEADDTTEQLIECTQLGGTILTEENLMNSNNNQLWKMINERIQFNIGHREEKM